MKILLDLDDENGLLLMALLKKINFIKVCQLTDAKATGLESIRESVKEMQQIQAGKKCARDIKDLFKGNAV